MKPPDFKQAQIQVRKIMRQIGKEPATFGNAYSPDEAKSRKWTCGQLLVLVFLTIVFLLVWVTVISILSDMWQKGLF